MNKPMRSVWAVAEPLVAGGELHVDLQGLLDAGLTVVDGGLFFTRELQATPHLRKDETDLTGQEAVINKLHLDHLVDIELPGWEVGCLVQGVLLAGRVLDAALALSALPVDVVITVDLGGPKNVGGELVETFPSSTFRFLLHRESETWVSADDLDRFAEPVAVLRRR